MVCKKVADEGTIWRIGDGCTVNVVCDPWISDYLSYRLHQPIDSWLHGLKVSFFLRDGYCNIPVIKQYFNDEIVTFICNVQVANMEVVII